MTTIYLLQHVYSSDSFDRETKIVGLYSSVDKAEDAAFVLHFQPGFIDHQDGFELYPIVLDDISCRERAEESIPKWQMPKSE